MALQSTLITDAGNDIFLCPGTVSTDEREYAITCMMFCNYDDTNPVELEVWVGPIIENRTKLINKLVIPAGETFTFDTEKLVLATGERIHAMTDENSRLTVTVSSMRVS
jgi:hypothetical protein